MAKTAIPPGIIVRLTYETGLIRRALTGTLEGVITEPSGERFYVLTERDRPRTRYHVPEWAVTSIEEVA